MKSLSLAIVMLCFAMQLHAAASLQLPMKLDYAEGVIMRSSSSQRIEQSDNDEAKAKLNEARDKYHQARKAQDDGDFASAESLANEAIRLVTTAAMKVSAKVDDNAAQKRRYDELLSQIETYRNWEHSNSQLDAETQAEMDNTILEIEKAAEYATRNDYVKANEFLSMALNIVIKVKNSTLKERTFSYDLNFETPIDEYKYELSRNDDYMRLVPIAIAQRQPSAGIQTLMDSYVKKAKVKRHDAESLFEAKSFQEAVSAMQDSTNDLSSALKIAGVR